MQVKHLIYHHYFKVKISRQIVFIGVARLHNVAEHISGFIINIMEEENK